MNSMDHDDYGPGSPISVPNRELFFLSYIRENSKGAGFISISSPFSGEAHVSWTGLLFLGPPPTHPLPQMRAHQFFGRQKFLPTEYSPSLVPLRVNSDEVEAVLFLKGQVNLRSRTGQVQGWDLCASVDDPSTRLHLLGLGGVRGRCETLP